jgi:O-antigen/teichoic acid export membrane protein
LANADSIDGARGTTEIASDALALRRNVLINAAGYTVKLGLPVLLAFATRTYGAAAWGVFVTLQALVMVMMRVTILGLDKAMLWWIPNRGPAGYSALRAAIGTVAVFSVVFGAVTGFAAEPLLRAWTGRPPAHVDSLRIMLLGLAPFGVTELLLHASMGRRRMEPSVIVRETLAPASLIGFALVFHAWGIVENGLAWAFVSSNVLAMSAALFYHRSTFADSRVTEPTWRIPPTLFGYAVPVWLAEIANSFLLRVSALVIAAFTDPVTVGVWGIVQQFGTAMRTIRGAFDSIVTVIAADIARRHDAVRLSSVLSYAAQLVTLTQFPLFAFLLIFADVILPLYGEHFARGTLPLIVLCSLWLLNGAAGLVGVVIAGYGKSKLTLLNTIVTITAQIGLMVWLVPRYGLIGGAIGLGSSYTVQHLFQLAQLKMLIGSFGFSRRAALPIIPAILGAAAGGLAYWTVVGRVVNPWLARGAVFGSFLLAYGLVTLALSLRGSLRAPG